MIVIVRPRSTRSRGNRLFEIQIRTSVLENVGGNIDIHSVLKLLKSAFVLVMLHQRLITKLETYRTMFYQVEFYNSNNIHDSLFCAGNVNKYRN